jgi:predicted Abi (CAAX) family protease
VGTVFPVMVAFSVVAVLNGAAFAYLRYGGVVPMPVELLPSRLVGAAVNAVAEEIQFRSLVLGMLLFAFPTQPVAMNLLQAILYGVVHRRLWNERDWYFLIGSVILGAAAGAATIATGSVVPAMVGHFAVTVSLFAFAGGRLRQRPV